MTLFFKNDIGIFTAHFPSCNLVSLGHFLQVDLFSELKGLCVYLQVSTAIKSMGTECC